MCMHDFSWNNESGGLPPGAPLSVSLSLLPGLPPRALQGTRLKWQLLHLSSCSFPIVSCFCRGERGGGGALPTAAEPPAVQAGVGASHLRLGLFLTASVQGGNGSCRRKGPASWREGALPRCRLPTEEVRPPEHHKTLLRK